MQGVEGRVHALPVSRVSLGPSFLEVVRELLGHGLLVVDGASQGELRDMCVARHLVESGRGGCREPAMR